MAAPTSPQTIPTVLQRCRPIPAVNPLKESESGARQLRNSADNTVLKIERQLRKRYLLAGRRISRRKLTVANAPNTFDTTSSAEEQCRRSQCHKSHEQGVLDKILPLVIFQKLHNVMHVFAPIELLAVSGLVSMIMKDQRVTAVLLCEIRYSPVLSLVNIY